MPNEIWAAVLGALLGAWIICRFALKLADKQYEQLAMWVEKEHEKQFPNLLEQVYS